MENTTEHQHGRIDMVKTDYAGIDYGLEQTNIDPNNGIRYGVINQNAFCSDDHLEPVYWQGCDHCGTEIADGELPDEDRFPCPHCGKQLDKDDLWGDGPIGWEYTDGEIVLSGGTDGDVFVIKSPVAIRAQFCSPCAPGAGHLGNPCDNGPMTYALPLEWFDEYHPAPYGENDLIRVKDVAT
jgi:hypothetical protein